MSDFEVETERMREWLSRLGMRLGVVNEGSDGMVHVVVNPGEPIERMITYGFPNFAEVRGWIRGIVGAGMNEIKYEGDNKIGKVSVPEEYLQKVLGNPFEPRQGLPGEPWFLSNEPGERKLKL